jgi:hypothetical protein
MFNINVVKKKKKKRVIKRLELICMQVLLEGKGAGAYTNTLQQYKAKADYFACACLQKNGGYNVFKTPGLYSKLECHCEPFLDNFQLF